MKPETLALILKNLALAQQTLKQARKDKLDNHLPTLQIEKSCLKDIEVLIGLVKGKNC